jgi:hypothetical protein
MQKKGVTPKLISHGVLAAFLVTAIILSVIGTFWNVDRINKINKFTGYGQTGYVNVTINTLTAINVTSTDCNFQSGYINPNASSALLESNGTITGWSGAGTSTTINVRNDGNTNLSLNVSSGKTLAQFYGIDCSSENCLYQFWSTNNETGACTSGLQAYPGANMDTNNKTVCSYMRFEDGNDDVYIHCRLNITQSIPIGAKTDTWTFYATGL